MREGAKTGGHAHETKSHTISDFALTLTHVCLSVWKGSMLSAMTNSCPNMLNSTGYTYMKKVNK